MAKHFTKPILAIHFMVLVLLMIGTKGSTQQISLSNEDNIGFARSCSSVAKEHISRSGIDLNDQISYWPSEIVEINRHGADIETKVRIGFKFETGGKNGWGTVEVKEDFNDFTCLFSEVARGEYPAPVGFIHSIQKRGVWVAYSGQTCIPLTRECEPSSGYRSFSDDVEGESSHYSTLDDSYWNAYYYQKVVNHFRNNR